MKKTNAEQRKVIRINRILGSTQFIVFCCVFVSIFFFLVANFLLNFMSSAFPILMKNIQNGKLTDTKELINIDLLFDINVENWIIYLIICVIIAVLDIVMVVKMWTAFHEYNIGQKGTQMLEKIDKLRKQYVSVKMNGKAFEGRGGLPIAYDKEKNAIFIDDGSVNALVLGVTRSGKLHDIIAPLIDIYSRANEKADLVILDPKLELYKMFREILEQRGTEPFLINLIDPNKSAKRNLFADCIDAYNNNQMHALDDILNSIANGIFYDKDNNDAKSSYFTGGALDLFKACIYALIEENIDTPQKVNVFSALNLVSDLSAAKYSDGTTALHKYFISKPSGSRARMSFNSVISSEGSQADTIATFNRKLSVFQNQLIAHLTSDNEIDFNLLGNSKQARAIFIGVPDYEQSYHFVASLLIQQISKIVSKNAANNQLGKNPREVVFLLEEMGNLPPVEGLESLTSVGLGRNIRYILILQSLAQLKDQYGENKSEIIMDNCSNQYFIKTNHVDTAEYFSKAVGSKTITNITRIGGRFDINKSITESYEERRLLDPNEITKFNYGEMLLLRNMKTTDIDGNDIYPLPVFTSDNLRMPLADNYIDLPSKENWTLGKYENRDITDGKTIDYVLFDTSKLINSIESKETDTINQASPKGGQAQQNVIESIVENSKDETIEQEQSSIINLSNFSYIKLAIDNILKIYAQHNIAKLVMIDMLTVAEAKRFFLNAHNDGLISKAHLESYINLFKNFNMIEIEKGQGELVPPILINDQNDIKKYREKEYEFDFEDITAEEMYELTDISELDYRR